MLYPSPGQVPHHAPISEGRTKEAEFKQPKEVQLPDIERNKPSEEAHLDQEMDSEELFTNREFNRQPAIKRRASTLDDSFTPTKPEAKKTALEPEQISEDDDDFSSAMVNAIRSRGNPATWRPELPSKSAVCYDLVLGGQILKLTTVRRDISPRFQDISA